MMMEMEQKLIFRVVMVEYGHEHCFRVNFANSVYLYLRHADREGITMHHCSICMLIVVLKTHVQYDAFYNMGFIMRIIECKKLSLIQMYWVSQSMILWLIVLTLTTVVSFAYQVRQSKATQLVCEKWINAKYYNRFSKILSLDKFRSLWRLQCNLKVVGMA